MQGSRRFCHGKRAVAYRCNLCVHFVAFTLALFLSHFTELRDKPKVLSSSPLQKVIRVSTFFTQVCSISFRLLSHFVRYHASDPNFHVLCGINCCSKTYRNCILSFIFVCGPLHYHVMNGQAAEQENGTNDMNSDSSASEMDEDSG